MTLRSATVFGIKFGRTLTLVIATSNCWTNCYRTADAAPPSPTVTTELRSHFAPDLVGTDQINSLPFALIPNLKTNDYAEQASAHGVTVSVVEGALKYDSGAPSKLVNGFRPPSSDAPGDNTFFDNDRNGNFRFTLNALVNTPQVNTYSRHISDRTPQRYTLYGSANLTAPSTSGDLAANGWRQIADVNMRSQFEAFNGVAIASIESLTGSLGDFRYLLFDVHGVGSDGRLGTFYSEIDIVGTAIPEPGSVALMLLTAFVVGACGRRR